MDMVVAVGSPRLAAVTTASSEETGGSETTPMAGLHLLQLQAEEEQPSLCCSSVVVPSETETESRSQHVQLISQLKLRDATVRERRRRLLGADMVVAPVRHPRRAQLGVLVHGERQKDAATARSEELRALDETLMRRCYKNTHPAATATSALHSSPKVPTKFTMDVTPYKLRNMLDDESPIDHSCVMEQEDPSILLQVEGLPCSASSNALSESRLRALLTAATLVDGEPRTDAATATSEEARALDETLMRRGYKNAHLASTATSALHSSPTVATKLVMEVAPYKLCNMLDDERPIDHSCVMEQEEDPSILLQVEGLLCSVSSNALSESRLHALLTAATLVDGERRTHHPAATATSEGETLELQRVKMQSGRSLFCLGPEEQQGASFLLQVDGPLCSNVLSSYSQQAQITDDAPTHVDGGQQTHRRAVVGDATEMGSMLASIFVKHVAGQLVLTIDLNECSAYMMSLYKQRTNTKLECQYFIYGRERLEPDSTLASYGVKGGNTIYVCTRLLGGAKDPNLQEYINNNKDNFVKVVTLLDGRSSLQMTPLGCQFLSSWIRCFTQAFTSGRSWNGNFNLVDFRVVKDHVRIIKKPGLHVGPGSVGADIIKFANEVERLLKYSDREEVLVSKHPPYVNSCMKVLRTLGSMGQLTVVSAALPSKYKVILDNLVCCMTSNARETLVIQLYRKYEGADENEAPVWTKAIKSATSSATSATKLSETAIFDSFIKKADGRSTPYVFQKTGTFTFMRDVAMHGSDCENAISTISCDQLELMIPGNKGLAGFLPELISYLVEHNIDISAELSEAVYCACSICRP